LKDWQGNVTNTALQYMPQGLPSPFNRHNRLEFFEEQRNRKAARWEFEHEEGTMEGKKLVTPKYKLIADPMTEY
jgi:hypothetical protein